MKLARWIFGIAATYGILILLVSYFGARQISEQYPPAITHTEYFYGFVSLALVVQFVFVLIAINPLRYRPLMIVSILEKLAFFIPATILKLTSSIPPPTYFFACIDLFLAVMFAIAYIATNRASRVTA
jgi:hypothetical protein